MPSSSASPAVGQSTAVPRVGPAPVDPRGPRFAAGLTSLVLALVLLTGSAWLLAAQAVVFALTAAGRGPYAVVFRRLVRPRLGPPAELEDPRPLRFAQLVGPGLRPRRPWPASPSVRRH